MSCYGYTVLSCDSGQVEAYENRSKWDCQDRFTYFVQKMALIYGVKLLFLFWMLLTGLILVYYFGGDASAFVIAEGRFTETAEFTGTPLIA